MNHDLIKSFDFAGSSADVFELFSGEAHLFFLDSSQVDLHRGRYSFIGFDPFDVFLHKGKDALDLLKERFNRWFPHEAEDGHSLVTPLTAGAVGCLSYDYGLHQEKIRLRAEDDHLLPDCFFGFYDCIITIDHFAQKLHVTSCGPPAGAGHEREQKASRQLARILKKLEPFLSGGVRCALAGADSYTGSSLQYEGSFSKEQYLSAVRRVQDYIRAGDIYQVNLSQRFRFDLQGMPWNPGSLYRTLRHISPAPFGGYMDCGRFHLLSNSPERFLRLMDGVVQTRPMKGTRPRGDNEQQDQRLRQELLNSAKEIAELLMITDLQRNDLGRVCEYGSVKVKEMRTLEEYPYVFQTTSMIEGLLRQDKDCFDLLKACFPGGSVTGCPKIRAMEIIDELEPARRGMYTGCLGYINLAGNMDFNILIRTLVACRGRLSFHVGGGVVADSSPADEYQETLIKAQAMRRCLEMSFAHPVLLK